MLQNMASFCPSSASSSGFLTNQMSTADSSTSPNFLFSGKPVLITQTCVGTLAIGDNYVF